MCRSKAASTEVPNPLAASGAVAGPSTGERVDVMGALILRVSHPHLCPREARGLPACVCGSAPGRPHTSQPLNRARFPPENSAAKLVPLWRRRRLPSLPRGRQHGAPREARITAQQLARHVPGYLYRRWQRSSSVSRSKAACNARGRRSAAGTGAGGSVRRAPGLNVAECKMAARSPEGRGRGPMCEMAAAW
ncbi:hypothetical protein FKM82_018319 [Ascaphus truei]